MECLKINRALILATSFCLFGCLNLGPDYKQPDLGVQIPSSYKHAPAGSQSPAANDRWWTAFKDQDLDRLVDEAVENNWDIKQAAARVLETLRQLDLGEETEDDAA